MNLPQCPQCGKTHLPVASRCPHCGEPLARAPFEPPTRLGRPGAGGLLVGIAVAAILAGAAWWGLTMEAGRAGTSAAALDTVPIDPVPLPAPTPVPAGPDTVNAAGDTTPAMDTLPRDPLPPPAPVQVTTRTRWAVNWANIRDAPALDAAVAGVLRPAQAVEVGEFVDGFFRVYLDGRPAGFVAADLLTSDAPADSIPR